VSVLYIYTYSFHKIRFYLYILQWSPIKITCQLCYTFKIKLLLFTFKRPHQQTCQSSFTQIRVERKVMFQSFILNSFWGLSFWHLFIWPQIGSIILSQYFINIIFNFTHNLYISTSDNFWSAFCVFQAHFWEITHSFKICALKKTQWFSTTKKMSFQCGKVQNRGEFIKVLE